MREIFAEDSRLQIIVAGTMWTEQIEDIALKWMKNPVICITSYLEAAIYSLVNFKLNITTTEEKIASLIGVFSFTTFYFFKRGRVYQFRRGY